MIQIEDIPEEALNELLYLSEVLKKLGMSSVYVAGSYPDDVHMFLEQLGLIDVMCASHEYNVRITNTGWRILDEYFRG